VVLVGHEIPTMTACAALAAARAGGARTILNPAPVGDLDAETVGFADVVTPNAGELAALEAAGIRPTSALVSLGAAGARLVDAGRTLELPAQPVTAVDTVGAGDTLNGALAAGLLAGYPLEDAARRAVVAASLAVTRAGAREGMPTLAELEAALAD
jgi:ribokinase